VEKERQLPLETLEGEIALEIHYQPGRTPALELLQGAMGMIASLDRLDGVLLSGVSSSLEPVSIINDVQHASLKLLLARALRHVPDEQLASLDYQKIVGGLLVLAKHKLLSALSKGADAPEVQNCLAELEPEYKRIPDLAGCQPPQIADVMEALDEVEKARARIPDDRVLVLTEHGDVDLPAREAPPPANGQPARTLINNARELFKIRSLDLLGDTQWTLIRNNRLVKATILHKAWLADYHARKFALLPGDALLCAFQETIYYDEGGNEIRRALAIVEVKEIIRPPEQLKMKV
jgi:hypothetical protein